MTPILKENKITRSIFKLLTGVIIGSAIGSILGLTLAPKNGAETRQILKDSAHDILSRSRKAVEADKKIGCIRKCLVLWLTRKKKTPVP